MKKSILLIGNYPPPYGGVPRVIEDLVPYLIENGWDVRVLSGGDGIVERKEGFTVYRLSRGKVKKLLDILRFLPKPIARRSSDFFRLLRSTPSLHAMRCLVRAAYASRIIEENGVCVVVGYNLYSGVPVGAMVSTVYDIPLIISSFGEIVNKQSFFLEHKGYVELVCRIASVMTSMTRHCADTYKILGISPQVEIVPVGVDTRRFNPDCDGSVIRDRLGIRSSDKVVLFVGRMVYDMGLHTLLDATADILAGRDDVSILIVGQEGDLSSSARRRAEEHKDRVFVVADVPLDELPLYYSASTILVAPTTSDRACGSLAVAEAMASGKPVIATRVGGIPEFVSQGDTGFMIPPEQPAVLADLVLRLLADEELARSMGERARLRSVKVFDVRKTNEMHERLFSRVAGLS